MFPRRSIAPDEAAEKIAQFDAQKAELVMRIRALATSQSVARTTTLATAAESGKPSTVSLPTASSLPQANFEEKPAAVVALRGTGKKSDVDEECHIEKCSRDVIGKCKTCDKGTCKRHLLPCVFCAAGVCKEHIKEHAKNCSLTPSVEEGVKRKKEKEEAEKKRLKKEADAKEPRELVEKLKARLVALEAKHGKSEATGKGGARVPSSPSSPESSSSSSSSTSTSTSSSSTEDEAPKKDAGKKLNVVVTAKEKERREKKERDKEPKPEVIQLPAQPEAPAFMAFKNATRQRICSASNAPRDEVFKWYLKVEDKDVAINELDDPENFAKLGLRISAAVAEIARGNFARELVLEGERVATCTPSRLLGGRRSLGCFITLTTQMRRGGTLSGSSTSWVCGTRETRTQVSFCSHGSKRFKV